MEKEILKCDVDVPRAESQILRELDILSDSLESIAGLVERLPSDLMLILLPTALSNATELDAPTLTVPLAIKISKLSAKAEQIRESLRTTMSRVDI